MHKSARIQPALLSHRLMAGLLDILTLFVFSLGLYFLLLYTVFSIFGYLKMSDRIAEIEEEYNLKLPEGEYYSEIEAPRGLASLYVKSTGEKNPYRLKWRTPSFYSVNILRKILVGEYLNDAIAIAGSLDIIVPEVDK